MKKKICWITSDSFLDVDKSIIPLMVIHFDLMWFIVLTPNNKLYRYKHEDLKQFAKLNNIKLQIIDQNIMYKDIRVIKLYFSLFCQIKRINPDILYSNLFGMPFYYPIMYLFRFKNVLYATHDVVDHINIKNRKLIIIYKKLVFNLYDNFQLFSEEQHKIFMSKYPNKNTFYAPLSLKNFGKSELKPITNKIIFLFFGSIRENKGLEILIEATKIVYSKRKEKFITKICGYTPEWERYNKLIGQDKDGFELHIDKIPNSEIPDLFSSSHYLVLPYKDVTQSGPLLIAYNYQVPVIASDLPGFREYIYPDKTGFLFDVGDFTSLSKIMCEIIDNHESNYFNIKDNLSNYIAHEISTDAIVRKYVEFFTNF